MKKSTKRIIELREKEAAISKLPKWEVMVPCGLDEFRMVEILADGWYFHGTSGNELIVFWKGPSFDEGNEVAVFNEWIYVRKTSG